MTELKRRLSPIDQDNFTPVASKRQKADVSMSTKERKEKLGEKITTLQQLVSPYGKTDTASVLLEAMDYIKFLHDQVNVVSEQLYCLVLKYPYPMWDVENLTRVLSAPYLQNTPVAKMEEPVQYCLRSKGLCLVPIELTDRLDRNNGADIWAPIKTGSPKF